MMQRMQVVVYWEDAFGHSNGCSPSAVNVPLGATVRDVYVEIESESGRWVKTKYVPETDKYHTKERCDSKGKFMYDEGLREGRRIERRRIRKVLGL